LQVRTWAGEPMLRCFDRQGKLRSIYNLNRVIQIEKDQANLSRLRIVFSAEQPSDALQAELVSDKGESLMEF